MFHLFSESKSYLTVRPAAVTSVKYCRDVLSVNKKAVLSQRWPRNAPYTWCPEHFRDSWLRTRLLFPTFFMGFCSNPPYECSFKIWNP